MPTAEPSLRILVVRSGGVDADRAARLVDPILDAWPEDARPEPVACTLDEVVESPASRLARADGVIAVLGAERSSAPVYRLSDAIAKTHSPTVLLCDDAWERPPGESDGVLVERWSSDPGEVAAALASVVRRQPLVERLAGELSIAQASLGGVQGQVARWQDEMQLAASVQQEFLPKEIPACEGMSVGVIFRPAGYVSGDIYDVCPVDDHRTAFFIADAVGHGVPAALLTLVIARAIRKTEGAGASARVLEPAEALTGLNREFCERMTDRSRFATAVYGVFDRRTNSVTLSGAGHPPPILSRHGDVSRVDANGPLLGVFPDAEYPQVTVELDPGDVLVLFSDGFETAFPDPDKPSTGAPMPTLTYLDKLAEAGAGECALDEAVRRLEHQLDTQAGSLHQSDDVTALLIAPTGAASGTLTKAA